MLNNIYKSYIFNLVNQYTYTDTAYPLVVSASGVGIFQQAIVGQLKLRHLHNFFAEMPLIKGAFFRLTLKLNNTSFQVAINATSTAMTASNIVCSLGGINPLMFASAKPLGVTVSEISNNGSATLNADTTLLCSVSVGSRCLNTSQAGLSGVQNSPLLGSVTLCVPSYTFNPIFEQSYLSKSVKEIVYNDNYQYQVLNVPGGTTFNSLITNGIANIQSVLVIPFYSSATNGTGGPTF